MKDRKLSKESFPRKIARWFFISIFTLSLVPTLFFYNVYTVVSEKNIKKIGKEIVGDLMYQNKATIDENYDAIIEFAKLKPEENIEFPTGVEGVNINIKAGELALLSQEEFYVKLPEIIVDNLYREIIDFFVDDLITNNDSIPQVVKQFLGRFSENNTLIFRNLFFLSLAICAVSAFIYFFVTQKKRAFIVLGVLSMVISLPPFLLIYFTLPTLNSVIRKTDFYAIASIVVPMIQKIQNNYLYFFIGSSIVLLFGILLALGINMKSLKIKRKTEFERVIKS